jgi:hypothetical protein
MLSSGGIDSHSEEAMGKMPEKKLQQLTARAASFAPKFTAPEMKNFKAQLTKFQNQKMRTTNQSIYP